MRILVTGANGYVGQWLCGLMQKQGIEVVGLGLQAEPRGEVAAWIQGDVTDFETMKEASKGCSAVVHLAATPQYASFEHPKRDLLVNGLGTLQTLRAAATQQVQRFVMVSSSAVYGASGGCLTEDTMPRPLSPYGVSKATAEAYTELFQRTTALHTVTLRLFNVYGRSYVEAWRPTVESRFLQAVLSGRRPTIIGDPDRSYDFVHVSDVVQAIYLALTRDVPPASVFNIGSGYPTSLQTLARWCLAAVGSEEKPVLEKGGGVPPPSHWADLRRSRQGLGYEPRQHIETWIKKMVQDYRSRTFAESSPNL
ncbi:MAG: NAD-dependent epimerase/dehydratase family protein [Chloroflexi bacterium]|nr:NAD-dependent epimerase/dehydratase family protein [Chloroflexota bacterium]